MILAKFGYRPDVKVEKFKNLFIYFGYMLEQEVNMCKLQWQKSDHQLGGYLYGWVITEIC
jgi:hypothetical protein